MLVVVLKLVVESSYQLHVTQPDGSQASRRKRARFPGAILEAKGEKMWLVRFDNGVEKDCPSATPKMLGDPRYNSAVASAPVLTSAPVASALVLPSAPATSASTTLVPAASAPVESGPVESGLVASGLVASGLVASGLVASGPVASGPVASGPVESGPVESAPVLASVISAINQVAMFPNIGESNAASHTTPMEDENTEFFIFIGIIIFSGAVGKGGKQLFEKQCDRQKEGVFRMSPTIDLTPYMAMRHFEDIKTYFPYAFSDFKKKTLLFPIMTCGTLCPT
jgi:hypothetical protein